MWFRRRNIGYAKSLKKYGHIKVQVKNIWTHEGPSINEKNDEHMKAYVLKKNKKDSHVSK